jgi:tRNA 2-thiouridine synthesizing protein E
MNKYSMPLILLIGFFLIPTNISSLSAGVEPSPFNEVVNKINAIDNNLQSIDKRLKHVISKLISKDDSSYKPGNLNRLDAMAKKLCGCQDQLDNILTQLPYDEALIPEVQYALVDVELRARIIVNRIDKLFINPGYIEIEPDRVKSNAQIIVYVTKEYIKPDNSCSSLSETNEITLSSFTIPDPTIDVDKDGFLCDPEEWDEDVARALAEMEGIDELSEEHWKVVNYLREYYLEFGVAPMIRKLCKATGFKLKKIYDLFPSGPAKGACKVAGLPKPTGCV